MRRSRFWTEEAAMNLTHEILTGERPETNLERLVKFRGLWWAYHSSQPDMALRRLCVNRDIMRRAKLRTGARTILEVRL